jgi:exopolysaccharide production protein ExoF
VQKPGEYSYRRAVTVLQAIGLAGGWYRPTDPGLMRLEREAITIRGDMRFLIRRYYYLAAQRARLSAELEMKTDIGFPAELTQKAVGDPALAQLLDEERSFLHTNIDVLKNQLDTLEKTLALYQMEVETASRQVAASKTQSQSVEKELGEVRALLARNLVPVARQSNLERLQAEIETARQGYQAQILRGQENVTQIEEKIFELKNQRQASLVKELEKVGQDLEEVAVKLDTSQNLMAEVQFTAPNMVSRSSDFMEARILTVVRMQDGKAVTFDAEETTELLPGDVLKVEKSMVPSGVAGRLRPGASFLVPTSRHD